MKSKPALLSRALTGPTEWFERDYVRPRSGRTMIVGSYVTEGKPDRRSLYEDVVGVDMREGPGVDRVMNLEDALPEDIGLFDHVECMSVLEHSQRPWRVAANIELLMRHGATIHFSMPFIWRPHDHPSDYWRALPAAIPIIFPSIEWAHLMYGSNQLQKEGKLPGVKVDGFPYYARTETFGFGFKRFTYDADLVELLKGNSP